MKEALIPEGSSYSWTPQLVGNMYALQSAMPLTLPQPSRRGRRAEGYIADAGICAIFGF